MTHFSRIISLNFCFVKPGSWIATVSGTDRPICFIWLTGWPFEVVSVFSFKFTSPSALSTSFTSLGISRATLLHFRREFWEECLCTYVFLNFVNSFYGLVVFPWDLNLSKKKSYYVIALLRSPHSGISFVVSVRSFLPRVFLLFSFHISLFDCMWPIL